MDPEVSVETQTNNTCIDTPMHLMGHQLVMTTSTCMYFDAVTRSGLCPGDLACITVFVTSLVRVVSLRGT
jgi:hypothetical protein